LEDVLRRAWREIRNELVIDRQVWGKDEEVTDAFGLMEVGNEGTHEARFTYAGCQCEAQRGEITLEVSDVRKLGTNGGECLCWVLALLQRE
jgi:hypothetical protein